MQLRSFTSLVVFVVVAVAVGFRMIPVDGVYAGAPQTRPAEKPQKPTQPAKEEDPVPVTERSQQAQPSFGEALGPDQFGSFFGPQINNRGDVAFIGRHRSSTAPDGLGQGIFVRTPVTSSLVSKYVNTPFSIFASEYLTASSGKVFSLISSMLIVR